MISRKINLYTFMVFISYFFSAHAFCWGKLGHRITAELADKNINEKTKKSIEDLIGPKVSLASISNHADFIKSDALMRKKYNHWHYISVDGKITVKEYQMKNPKKENLIFGINHFTNVLKDSKHSKHSKYPK